jgi:hypothetical protein
MRNNFQKKTIRNRRAWKQGRRQRKRMIEIEEG